MSDVDSFWSDLLRGWKLEHEAERLREREERADFTLPERVARGWALRRLEIDETGAATGGRLRLRLTSPEKIDIDRFRGGPGSPATLWWESPDAVSSVPAIIQRCRADQLTVVVDDIPDRLFEGEFNLDLEAPTTTFRAGERAINEWENAPDRSDVGRLRAVLVEGEAPHRRDAPEWEPLDERLNAEQRAAVEAALASEDVLFLHGPPGTGKTRTLVEIVRQAVARGERVICSAASNAAVDHLASSLATAGEDPVRLGHPARVSEEVEALTLDARIEETTDWALARKWIDEANAIRRRIDARSGRGALSRPERSALYRQARNLMGDAHHHIRRLERSVVGHASIVCTTATTARSSILDDEAFDLCVIDEATQLPDPLAFIPLARAPRAVIAGDPQQLPPTILSREAERLGLGETLLERHVEQAIGLRVQHRMHADIMNFPSHASYAGELVAHDDVAGHRLEELGVAADPLRESPFIFVDVAGKGWDDARDEAGGSSFNPGTAARVVAEVERLIGRGVKPEAIAVITPYRAQVARLRSSLPEGVEVDTIDSFQGREAEVVVVDLVRSNPELQIGFLSDIRRMNVALTRARRQLIVVGDSATLAGTAYYDALLAAAEEIGDWLSAWADEAPPFEG